MKYRSGRSDFGGSRKLANGINGDTESKGQDLNSLNSRKGIETYEIPSARAPVVYLNQPPDCRI